MISQRNLIKCVIIISFFVLFYIAYQHSAIRSAVANYKYAKSLLSNVAIVDIDRSGRFKYILIKLIDTMQNDSTIIVRGFNHFNYHAQICKDAKSRFYSLPLNVVCLSGGRIEHFPDLHKIKVYGYSKTFGQANHTLTKLLLLTKYPDYDIETSNLGY